LGVLAAVDLLPNSVADAKRGHHARRRYDSVVYLIPDGTCVDVRLPGL
jgi:hypothetical protein